MNLYKRAFTLVELIIVIVILAILASISFITLKDYPKDARDAVRKTDLANMKKVLDIYKIHSSDGRYPSPDEPVTTSGSWQIGEFGAGVLEKVKNISPLPVDPATGKNYTYKLNSSTGEMELLANLENGETYSTKTVASSGGGNTSSGDTNHTTNTFTPTPDKDTECDATSPPRFIAGIFKGKAVCKDKKTNKYWLLSEEGQNIQWANCTDNFLCLSYGMPDWRDSTYTYPSGKTEDDYPAFKYCTTKGAGWRLPTKDEFDKNTGGIMEKISQQENNSKYTKLNISTHNYWSIEEDMHSTNTSWFAGFSFGDMGNYTKNRTLSVICIHD